MRNDPTMIDLILDAKRVAAEKRKGAGMTVNQLIKRLEKIRAEQGNVKVVANAQELWDSCNRVWNLIDVRSVEFQVIEQCDGDGAMEYDSKGRGKTARVVVIGS